MSDTPNPIPDARSPRSIATTNSHAWLRTAELCLLFLVLAILADAIGTGSDETTAIVERRSPHASAGTASREALAPGRSISVAARPATPR